MEREIDCSFKFASKHYYMVFSGDPLWAGPTYCTSLKQAMALLRRCKRERYSYIEHAGIGGLYPVAYWNGHHLKILKDERYEKRKG